MTTDLIPEAAELAALQDMLFSRAARDGATLEMGVTADQFGRQDHRQAFEAIMRLHDQGAEEISGAMFDEAYGDPEVSSDLWLRIGTADWRGGVVQHLRIVQTYAVRRRHAQAARLLYQAAVADDSSLLDQALGLLENPDAASDTTNRDALRDKLCEYLAGTGQPGLPTSFPKIDRLIGGGLRPGDCTALAAWTGMGKTALAFTILEHVRAQGKSVHSYINEMSDVDLGLRMVARQIGSYGRLVRRELTPDIADAAMKAIAQLPNIPITDVTDWRADQIARHIRSTRADVACIDHIHNMDYADENDLRRIIRVLAAAARSSSTHVILVCQFNDGRAKDEILPRPVLRDIKGSSQIRQSCRAVLFMHRTQEKNQDGGVDTLDEGYLTVAKANHGAHGAVPIVFDAQRMRFTELAPQGSAPVPHWAERDAA